jgi:hypothetical protein
MLNDLALAVQAVEAHDSAIQTLIGSAGYTYVTTRKNPKPKCTEKASGPERKRMRATTILPCATTIPTGLRLSPKLVAGADAMAFNGVN